MTASVYRYALECIYFITASYPHPLLPPPNHPPTYLPTYLNYIPTYIHAYTYTYTYIHMRTHAHIPSLRPRPTGCSRSRNSTLPRTSTPSARAATRGLGATTTAETSSSRMYVWINGYKHTSCVDAYVWIYYISVPALLHVHS